MFSVGLFSAKARCFPQAWLEPPRSLPRTVGSQGSCYSCRSQRAFAPNSQYKRYKHIG